MFSFPFKKNKSTTAAYEEKPFFEKQEQVFFGRLRRAVPTCYIFPKVDLNDLLEPMSSDPKLRRAEQADLEGRKVDYAIFDASMNLLCVIELNEELDDDGKYLSNEAFFKTAGIKTIRWERQALPIFDQILRILAPFSTIAAPKPDIAASTVMRTQQAPATNASANPDTVQAIYSSCPTPSNIVAMSIHDIERLTPKQYIKTAYPHLWQRICLFCNEPMHLKRYLTALVIQGPGENRVGFPNEILLEIASIQAENERHLEKAAPRTTWDTAFINR
ncbi:DUF2726 domain-containing protein [Undibacterium sp. Jales W-56]|uniref:DUF2726 domain-containing protein n=1 Tax=Undibacterium sp. Jales W-56 TaxID=2897325 RepID=UPI0021D1FC74|nr:DUF2726 domain-containing protein [Undibacterium sp. Jales W-56]MCU6435630.1 DUF2726 domain-containing protein [Undibacterium sp. Jales W-56]